MKTQSNQIQLPNVNQKHSNQIRLTVGFPYIAHKEVSVSINQVKGFSVHLSDQRIPQPLISSKDSASISQIKGYYVKDRCDKQTKVSTMIS